MDENYQGAPGSGPRVEIRFPCGATPRCRRSDRARERRRGAVRAVDGDERQRGDQAGHERPRSDPLPDRLEHRAQDSCACCSSGGRAEHRRATTRMSNDDAEVIVVLGSLLHDLGMSIHRADHEQYSLFVAQPSPRPAPRRALRRSHRDDRRAPRPCTRSSPTAARAGPMTIEAGVVAGGGRARHDQGALAHPLRSRPGEHPLPLGRIDRAGRDPRGETTSPSTSRCG